MKQIVRAHTNIALIKYWGKANKQLRLPLMSSLSMTLDAFYTDTYVKKTNGKNCFYLNGKLQNGKSHERVFSYLEKLKTHFGIQENLVVNSINHVPTAAGLASSSSAFAALAAAFLANFKIKVSKKELSILARLGSGSASRSIYGGFAIWQKGQDSQTSYAYPLIENPQMDLHLLVIELEEKAKDLSSTLGMKNAQTSPFFKPWIKRNPAEIEEMILAIKNNDFSHLGSLAELNANEMHAINATAKPSFTYFTGETLRCFNLVQQLRNEGLECYYTIDAGPNPKIICQLRNVKEIKRRFAAEFGHAKIIDATFGPGISVIN